MPSSIDPYVFHTFVFLNVLQPSHLVYTCTKFRHNYLGTSSIFCHTPCWVSFLNNFYNLFHTVSIDHSLVGAGFPFKSNGVLKSINTLSSNGKKKKKHNSGKCRFIETCASTIEVLLVMFTMHRAMQLNTILTLKSS